MTTTYTFRGAPAMSLADQFRVLVPHYGADSCGKARNGFCVTWPAKSNRREFESDVRAKAHENNVALEISDTP